MNVRLIAFTYKETDLKNKFERFMKMKNYILDWLNEHSDSKISDDYLNINYLELSNILKRHANILKSTLKRKSKCAILCHRGLFCAISILACWFSDLVVIPLSLNYGFEHCKKIVDLVAPDIIITDNLSLFPYKFIYNIKTSEFSGKMEDFKNEEILDDIAAIMCTSGTTGVPKGALLTESALINNVLMISNYFDINKEDKIMIARPLYHCAVLTGEFLVGLFKGLDMLFFDKKYNPWEIIEHAVKNQINVLCATPTLFNHISIFINRRKILHHIKKIAISGECLNISIAINIRKGFPETTIYNVYGLTEASPRVSYLPPDKFDCNPESVGIPLQGVQIKIVSEKNYKELPLNSNGLVMVKSPSLMKAYYKNEVLTSKVLSEGWLNTGDIGYVDSNGFLNILSRIDDMIIKAGMNIYPKEIEEQIFRIKQVKECIVYGIKSDIGQSIATDIVLNNDYDNMTLKELTELISEILPSYQMPEKINIVSALLKNASGKTIRKR